MTVVEVIKRSAEFLARKGVDSPRLNVELLLAQVLKLPRMGLYLNFGRELTPAEMDELRKLVTRRGQREPLQHILGSTSFCGLELEVGPHVLVPRPETEELAELGWNFLNGLAGREGVAGVLTPHPDTPDDPAHAHEKRQGTRLRSEASAGQAGAVQDASRGPVALDFGTGSGCLAILLAVRCPAARILAVDVSPEALTVARRNAERHQMHERVQFIEGDGFAAKSMDTDFDLIISNPPYIPAAEIETLQPEVRDFDPRLALNGGVDGLDYYRRLAAEAAAFLRTGGKIMLEFGDGQAEAIKNLFETQKWIVESIKADYSGRSRFLTAQRAE